MDKASPLTNLFDTITDRRNTVPAGIALGALLVLFVLARLENHRSGVEEAEWIGRERG